MVKISAKVTTDAVSLKGRVIGVRVDTDDPFINQVIGLPKVIQKTYPISISAQDIRKDMRETIKDLIKGAKKRLKDDSLFGKEMEIEI